MTLHLRWAAVTDRGHVRSNNQDAYYAGDRLLVVADGMGGMAAGDVASRIAVEAMTSLDVAIDNDSQMDALHKALEVANGKIADPYDARDPDLVESQYSFNSLLDFADNIRGVKNAYTGDMPAAQTAGRGLSEYVAARDPALDTRVLAELDAAIATIGVIPDPFRDAIQAPANDAAIEAAQQAIRTVQATIDGDLTTLVLGP